MRALLGLGLLNKKPSLRNMLRRDMPWGETGNVLVGIARELFRGSDTFLRYRTDSKDDSEGEVLTLYYDNVFTTVNPFAVVPYGKHEVYKAIRVRIVKNEEHAVDFLTSTGWHNLEDYQGPNAVYREKITEFLQEPKTWEERVRFAMTLSRHSIDPER